MEIIVGRAGQQPFSIADKTVSKKHLKLTTLSNGNVMVEDLDSTHGTYINGLSIVKKEVTPNTVVQMGPTYTFRISDAITDDKAEFKKLEEVWNNYQKRKIAIMKNNAIKGYLRVLPMFILGLLGYLISCIPELNDYRMVITIAGVAVGVILTIVSFSSAASTPELLEKLNQQFQIDYVCPKCKQFLGFVPYEGLVNKAKCSYCKTQWV